MKIYIVLLLLGTSLACSGQEEYVTRRGVSGDVEAIMALYRTKISDCFSKLSKKNEDFLLEKELEAVTEELEERRPLIAVVRKESSEELIGYARIQGFSHLTISFLKSWSCPDECASVLFGKLDECARAAELRTVYRSIYNNEDGAFFEQLGYKNYGQNRITDKFDCYIRDLTI